MKKTIAALLALVMGGWLLCVVFVGCGTVDEKAETEKPSSLGAYDQHGEETDGEPEAILIHLELDGGSTAAAPLATGRYGERIYGLPLDLEKEGHRFIGWFTAPDCGGLQIATEKGLIPGREILNETIGAVKGKTESLTLYAGFVKKNVQVTLRFGDSYETVAVEYGVHLESRVVNGVVAKAYSVNPSGYPLYTKPITCDMTLYVVSYEMLCEGKTVSTADNNGYDPKASGSHDNIAMHRGWQLGNVGLSVDQKSGSETEYRLSYHVLEDPYRLPVGQLSDQLKDCWLHNDSYANAVCGTNIKGDRVGFGAYYVEVVYRDGTTREFSDTNFLAGASQHEEVALCAFSGKKGGGVKEINVSVVYELCFNNKMSYWLGFTWAANYICKYNFSF